MSDTALPFDTWLPPMFQWHGAKLTNNSTTIFWDPRLLHLFPLPRLCSIVLWPPQPFGPSAASSANTFSNTHGSPSTAPNLPSRPEHPQQAAICRDFNRRTCCCPNWQFKHICNKSDCGSRKLPWLPLSESTSAVIFLGKYLKVSWIGAVSSWGLGSLSYSSIRWRTCLNLAAWYSWGAISFVRFWISCRGSIWKVWLSWLTALRPLFRGIQLGMSEVLHNLKLQLGKRFSKFFFIFV